MPRRCRPLDRPCAGCGRGASAGKHVFLEKPGATTLADHDLLVEEAGRRPAQVVQVGYQRRYDAGSPRSPASSSPARSAGRSWL